MHDAAEAHARVLVYRRENLRTACNRSRIRHDRFPHAARSSQVARDCSRAFSEMNSSSAPLAGILHTARPGSTIPAATLLAAWRAFAVVFFSACALAEIMEV